jgi:hypothetical protein
MFVHTPSAAAPAHINSRAFWAGLTPTERAVRVFVLEYELYETARLRRSVTGQDQVVLTLPTLCIHIHLLT